MRPPAYDLMRRYTPAWQRFSKISGSSGIRSAPTGPCHSSDTVTCRPKPLSAMSVRLLGSNIGIYVIDDTLLAGQGDETLPTRAADQC